jgi:hypothetical protein
MNPATLPLSAVATPAATPAGNRRHVSLPQPIKEGRLPPVPDKLDQTIERQMVCSYVVMPCSYFDSSADCTRYRLTHALLAPCSAGAVTCTVRCGTRSTF